MHKFQWSLLIFFVPAFIFAQSAYIQDSTSALLFSGTHIKFGKDTGKGFSAGLSYNDSYDVIISSSSNSFSGGKASTSGIIIEPMTKKSNGFRLAAGLGLGTVNYDFDDGSHFKSLFFTYNFGMIASLSSSKAVDVYMDAVLNGTRLVDKRIENNRSASASLTLGMPFIFKVGKSANVYLEPAYAWSDNTRLFAISAGLLIHLGQ